jgi:hypothetical protein
MIALPYEERIINTGEPIESENLVEFRLLYCGELLASTNTKRRTQEKHAIRKVFHPQLRRLWQVKSGLHQLAEYLGNPGAVEDGIEIDTNQSRFDRGIARIGRNWRSAPFDFVPLITERFLLRCSLDILLLRPEGKEYIFEQGDIDGQLKTLFDAFRRPCDIGEAGGNTPTDDENPFFVLLQDDKLISEVHVTTDQLLLLPGHRETKATDAYITIHAKLNHTTGSPFDRWFD